MGRPDAVCYQTDCAAENKPFVSEDEEGKPGDVAKEDQESNKNEEVEPFWMTFALSTVTTHIGQ